ncbi:hypothetical protein [Haloferula rosea]|uniref:Uncharacterized protein n=1 Tax=Haloferula rosea TaxID=490093 RepID=A0A934VHT3_9BACT|nr:hypothetical protein [Haloferula rosea]MBK1829010.1 hypothetical protein [Haloferula rosea]
MKLLEMIHEGVFLAVCCAGLAQADVVVESPNPQEEFAQHVILGREIDSDVRLAIVEDDPELKPEGFRIALKDGVIHQPIP